MKAAPPSDETPPTGSAARWRGGLQLFLGGFLPGALAGTQLAGLLFFLNPHLPFGPLPVLRGIVQYALLLGGLSLALTLPFTWNRPGRALRWLPVGLTIVLAAAAVGALAHASHFAFFLPPGINRRLLKAALWLSLGALICFYTVLLHRLRHRPYGRRGWVVFALIAVASIYVVVERREAFGPPPRPDPRATTFEGSTRPLVCVIGIESATFDAILPLAEQGLLPFFSKMLSEGSHARLEPLLPVRRSALWATLATGKYPYRHGVVGERSCEAAFAARTPGASLELLPLGIGFEHWGCRRGERVDSRSLEARPLWEILSRLGVPTALVGWPLTSPPAKGIHRSVSDRFFVDGPDDAAGDDVFPVELAERARLFRTAIDELDPEITSRFGPQPPRAVLESLARDLWIRDLGVFLLDQDPQIDAFFLALPGLAEISRRYYGGYDAVQFEGEQDPESAQAAGLVSAYYVHLDEILAQLWELGRAPRWLVVVSTHGTEGSRGWHEIWRRLFRRPALEGFTHRGPDGVLLFLGEGFQPGAMRRSADLVDLVPTLLYGLGFPIARDLDGAVLTDAFDTGFLARQPLTFVPSYETFARPP